MRRPLPLAGSALIARFLPWPRAWCCGCHRRAPFEVCAACAREACVGPGFHGSRRRGRFHLAHYSVAGSTGLRPTTVAKALVRFKYEGDRQLGHRLARLFARHAPSLPRDYDMIVPIPLHPRKLRRRGFNQAAWLARAAARTMRVPLRARALRRAVEGPVQASLGGTARRRLARCVFAAGSRSIQGATVLLVDDVATTGTTAAAAVNTLVAGGARRVDVAVLLSAAGPRARGPI